MKYKTLCKLSKQKMVFDDYTGETLTVQDAISTINDRWSDYDGVLYPIDEYKEDVYGNMIKAEIDTRFNTLKYPEGFNLSMTKEFADMFALSMSEIK